MSKVYLLDCTLREAPIDDLIFGQDMIQKFIHSLEDANIDIIECGFLKDVEHVEGSSIYKRVEEITPFLRQKQENSIYVALVDYGRYNLKNLSPFDGTSIDGIRICFKKGEQNEAIEYAKIIKARGYKVFIQHVDTLGYSDIEILEFLNAINDLKPYAYSIVDTFGSMYANDLRRICSMVNHNLDKEIVLGFHAHNNLMLANANTQEFVNIASAARQITIDSSVLGCGRGAGNAHTELLVEFLNKKKSGKYDINIILDIIDNLMPKLRACSKSF